MTRQRAVARHARLPEGNAHGSPSFMAKRRMLCATDLTQYSRRVVSRAAVMASHLDAELILLHVVDSQQDRSTFAAASDRMELQWKSVRSPGRCEPVIRLHAGEYVPTIAAIADQSGAELIVLGSQRWKPLVPLIAASAGELASQVRCPMLLVRRDSRAPYGSVLIAAEQSAGLEQVLRIASSLRLLESECVAILHGFELPYRGALHASGFDAYASKRNLEEWELAARRRLLQDFDATGVASEHFRFLFAQSRSMREIQKELRRVGPDLLVIAARDHSALDRVMSASTGNDALRKMECDVLVMPVP